MTSIPPTIRSYTSTDDGRTFAESDRARLGPARWTRAGYVAGVDRDWERSADGQDRHRFALPAG